MIQKIPLKKSLYYVMAVISCLSGSWAGPILDDMVAKKTIVIGYRESTLPYSFIEQEGKPIGYSLDICHKIIDRINKEKNTKLTVQYQVVFPQIWVTLLQNSSVHIVCSGTTATPERLSKTKMTTINADVINPVVLASNTTITKKEDLKGKRVILLPATAGERAIHQLNDQDKFGIKTIYATSYSEALSLLEKGEGDAVVMTKVILAGEIAESKNPQLFKILDIPLSNFDLIGLMYSKDDPELGSLIEAQVSEMKKDGSLYKLYDKWFNSPIGAKGIHLNLPLTDAQKKALNVVR